MFLEETGWKQGSVKLFCDNQSALKMMKIPSFHGRTKHIDIQLHFIRELVEFGELEFEFVGTNQPKVCPKLSLIIFVINLAWMKRNLL